MWQSLNEGRLAGEWDPPVGEYLRGPLQGWGVGPAGPGWPEPKVRGGSGSV